MKGYHECGFTLTVGETFSLEKKIGSRGEALIPRGELQRTARTHSNGTCRGAIVCDSQGTCNLHICDCAIRHPFSSSSKKIHHKLN